MAINDAEFKHLRDDVQDIKQGQKELKKIMIGNGEFDKSFSGRLLKLEYRVGSTPTWQWLIEKLAVPLVTALTTAGLLYFIFGAP